MHTAQQVARLLQRLELQGVERIEHCPALAVEALNARPLVREARRQLLHKVFVAAPHLDLQAL
jgi:hypothetical protein